MHVLRFLGEVSLGVAPGAARRQVSRPRSVAVLACLAASERGGITRDRLVALLWEDQDRSHSRHNLANQLHILRRSLGSDAILTTSDFVSLNRDVVPSDVDEFKCALDRGDLLRAAELYRGPFLDGFHLKGAAEFERWADAERHALASRALETFEALASRATAAGDPEGAVRWLQRAVSHDPYNSRAAVALGRALAASLDPGNAVQLLREHAQKLRDDLGIEPDPEVLALIDTADFGLGGRVVGTPALRATPHGTGAQPRSPDPLDRVAGARGDAAAPPAGDTSPASKPMRLARGIAVLAGAFALVVASGLLIERARGGEKHDADQVAILPVRAVGVDSAVASLLSARLHAELADWETHRAVPPHETESAWRRLRGSTRHEPSRALVRRFGKRLGAGRVLVASVAGSEDGVEVTASLVAVPGGEPLASARAEGPLDGLGRVAHALVVQLEGQEQGIPADRIRTLLGHDPAAVRLFLQAHPHESELRDRLLRQAIERDSTFALAALELYESFWNTAIPDADDPAEVAEAARWSEVAAIIWEHRDSLSPADRAYAEARVGWRYDPEYTAAKHVAAWERAVQVAPDRLASWQGLFGACYQWCSSFRRPWRGPLLEIHDALLQRGDSSQIEVAMEVALAAGDSARLRAYANILSEDEWYGRWLAAVGLGREAEHRAVIAAIPGMDDFPLMRIGNAVILTGLALEDAELVAREPQRGDPGSIYELRRTVVARERGRHAEYRRLRDKLFQYFDVRQGVDAIGAANVIAEWAFFGEPETEETLNRMDTVLTRIVAEGTRGSPDSLALAHCYRGVLRLEREDRTGVPESVRFLRAEPAVRSLALSRMCAPFLEYLVARGEGRAAHAEAARRLHDAVRERPLTFGRGPGMYYTDLYIASAANLALARSFGDLGHPETGLQIVERRPVEPGYWGLFGFHIEFVREEARLLALAGETKAAAARYEKYFRFRSTPPDLPSWAEDWEEARAEYEALLEVPAG